MKDKKRPEPTISRRGLFTLIGAMAMAPLATARTQNRSEGTEYITVMKADGTAVRIPKNVAGSAKVVHKKVSNKKLLNWIRPKGS